MGYRNYHEPPMSQPARVRPHLSPEKLAYWYFRLNGFFQIENFVVHPPRSGSQRTDADLLAVRFPNRAERLIDDPTDVMPDDVDSLSLSPNLIDVVIAEVKTNTPCALNGPWTEQEKQNVHRVLAAIGCLPPAQIDRAAEDIYRTGLHLNGSGFRIRLVAVGRERSDDLPRDVTQLVWSEMLAFIWKRFDLYKRQKTQVDQWDPVGRRLRALAVEHEQDEFEKEVLGLIGARGS